MTGGAARGELILYRTEDGRAAIRRGGQKLVAVQKSY